MDILSKGFAKTYVKRKYMLFLNPFISQMPLGLFILYDRHELSIAFNAKENFKMNLETNLFNLRNELVYFYSKLIQ